jgi:dUTP pyrophosphatase
MSVLGKVRFFVVELKIKKLYENATIPSYGSACAAGADLYSCEGEMTFEPGETKMVHTGIAMEIPDGYVGLIYARSGIATKRGLAPSNKVGVIDSDYRGEIMVSLHNHSNKTATIEAGERIAQIVITPYLTVNFIEVDSLDATQRGTGGFGSTGTK